MLVSAKDMMNKARDGKYAVGQFNINNLEWTKAISLGVAKINVNTECQLVFAEATRKYIEEGKDLKGKGFDPRKLLLPGYEAILAKVEEKMNLFGSVGKAF